jgi:hypothetical protein
MRLQTCAMRAKEATSAIASSRRMWERISSGISARGQGFWGENSVSGGSGSIWSCEKLLTNCLRVAGIAGGAGSCAVGALVGSGRAAEALDEAMGAGLGFANVEAGKCFFL